MWNLPILDHYLNQSPKPVEQSPFSEANSRLAGQENPRLLGNLKFHCHVHNSSPLDSILSHFNPIEIFPHHYFKDHSNSVLPSALGYPKR
jgi:hypothetical protein